MSGTKCHLCLRSLIPGILQETSKITSTSTGVPSGIYKRQVVDKLTA